MQGYKRVDGPSEDELKKKYEEGRKDSPFSNPSREILYPSESLLSSLIVCSTHLLPENLNCLSKMVINTQQCLRMCL